MDQINIRNPLLPRKLNSNGDRDLFPPKTNNDDQNPLDETKGGRTDNHPGHLDFVRRAIDNGKENISPTAFARPTYPEDTWRMVLKKAYQKALPSWTTSSDQGNGTNPFRKAASQASDMEADFKARYPEVPRNTNPFRGQTNSFVHETEQTRFETQSSEIKGFGTSTPKESKKPKWENPERVKEASDARVLENKLNMFFERGRGDWFMMKKPHWVEDLGRDGTDTELTEIQKGDPAVYFNEETKIYNFAFNAESVPKHFGKRVDVDDEVLQKIEAQEQRPAVEGRGEWYFPKEMYRIEMPEKLGEKPRILITDNEKYAQKLIQEQHLNGKVFDLSGVRKPGRELNQDFFQYKFEEHQESGLPTYEAAKSWEPPKDHMLPHEYEDFGYSFSRKRDSEYDGIKPDGETRDEINDTSETGERKEYGQYDAPPSYTLIHLRNDYKSALANYKVGSEILELEEKYRDLYDGMRDRFGTVDNYPKKVKEKMGRLLKARLEFVEEDRKRNGNGDKALRKVRRRLQKTMKSIEKALSQSGGREIINDTTKSSSENQYDSNRTREVDSSPPLYDDAVRDHGLPSMHEKHNYTSSNGEKQRVREYIEALEKLWIWMSDSKQPIPSGKQWQSTSDSSYAPLQSAQILVW